MSEKTLPITVDWIKQDEFEQWLPFWKAYQEFYHVDLSDDITDSTWHRFFDTNQPMFCAVAKEGDKVLGFVHYLFHLSTWAGEDFCYLEDLFVSPEARGKQIGKQLIEFVKKEALTHKCARLYWHTQETNATAQRLYDWVAIKPGVIEYRLSLV